MWTILIIDDEYWIREGLKTAVDWEEYGYTIIGEAKNAREGYEQYRKLLPDIIISDIKMGKTNGLDTLEKIHAERSETELIVLSGYDDFNYAQRAIEYGACAYLLKPVDPDELLKAIQKAKKRLSARKTQQSLFIEALASGKALLGAESPQVTDSLPFALPKEGYYVISISLPELHTLSKETKDALLLTLAQSIENALCRNRSALLASYPISGGTPGYTLLLSGEYCMPPFPNLYTFAADFQRETGRRLTAGVSTLHTDFSELSKANAESSEALGHSLLSEKSICIFSAGLREETDSALLVWENRDVDDIVACIFKIDYNGAEKIITDFFDRAAKMHPLNFNELKNSTAKTVILILHNVFKTSDKQAPVFPAHFSPWNELEPLSALTEIKSWLLGILDKIFCDPNIYLGATYHPDVQAAISLIMQQYNKDITAGSIAGEIGISESHLMRLFKTETGKTFHNFLTEYRIQTAVRLLEKKKYKIYEVVSMVGYTSTEQFRKNFKKVTGHSPKQYYKDRSQYHETPSSEKSE